jgi:hypothetical protein
MSAHVQVFGRRYAETIDARWGPASEKRQGRKSRSVVQRRRGWVYGDLAPEPDVRSLDLSGCRDGFAAKHGLACRCERALGALRDKICDVTVGESSEALRAWAVPAESQQECRGLLRFWINGDGVMRCRS